MVRKPKDLLMGGASMAFAVALAAAMTPAAALAADTGTASGTVVVSTAADGGG